MEMRELFASDVTRDIAPVVYFHEQEPEMVAEEVGEYIITGGYPDDHPHHQRVPDGIHEQYVHLLGAIVEELERNGGPDLPSSWISGFYGSGKSSFAKLLGLALDGIALPDGGSLSEAWLARDTSPRAEELRQAWQRLREKVDPIAVVFDIGGVARDNEHIHGAVVRLLQKRLGYCSSDPLVAEFELRLERDDLWKDFEAKAAEVLGKPWAEVKDRAMAEEEFSHVMHELEPARYTDPMMWITSRVGTANQASSAEEATRAIADMLRFRAPDKTLFVVVDEVSQYIHQDQQRMLKLQSFVSELGQRLKGRVWLLVTGQQKLEDSDETHVLGKLKGRFKQKLRVHLGATNIRDVVHKRLLQKTPEGEAWLRDKFREHRNDLSLFAYGCESITEEDFVEVYPMLPQHIDLLLQITTALRTRSSRSQGDDQAIRGLLQLLGELFRSQKLADAPAGSLVTLDQIYDVQRSALDADVQTTMSRILAYCSEKGLDLAERAAKAVALLELVQETIPTDKSLVARCLFDRLDRGRIEDRVEDALGELRRANLLGYSEKQGYKIQSSSGEEWERERRDIPVSRDALSDHVQEALRYLVSKPARPTLNGRPFPWRVFFSDGGRASDAVVEGTREPANVTVDLQMPGGLFQDTSDWTNLSAEKAHEHRICWVGGSMSEVESQAREYSRSIAMVKRYKPRRDSLPRDRQRLLVEEDHRSEDLVSKLESAVDVAWMSGTIYFRGRAIQPRDFGASFVTALGAAGNKLLPELYPHFLTTQVSPAELMPLLDKTLSAPSPKFLDELGLLSLDAGRYEPTCKGVAPQRIAEFLDNDQAASGATLLTTFGGPPFGYAANVVRACVAALLRASKLRIQIDEGPVVTAVRDAGVRDLFEQERAFRRATVYPAGDQAIGARDRNRICAMFKERLQRDLDRDNDAIADAVAESFPAQIDRLHAVLSSLAKLPARPDGGDRTPPALEKLQPALEACYRSIRQTEATVQAVKRHVEALDDGLQQLALYHAELTDDAISEVRSASEVLAYQWAQLETVGGFDAEIAAPVERIRSHVEAERPWRENTGIHADAEAIRGAYSVRRGQILEELGAAAEAVRSRVKKRREYSTLTAEQSQKVLRPVVEAVPETSEDAVSPTLQDLEASGHAALLRAETESNAILDQILSEGSKTVVRTVSLDLHNREVASREELEDVLEVIRSRVGPELEQGHRVRLV